MTLSPIQKEIIELPGNIIVKASAGTGKTHTLVNKIEYDIKKNHTHKVIAAITFTIKAAKEIRNRITIDTFNSFIGTNNSFAIDEVIKPFMKDTYGKEFKIDMSSDYSIKISTFIEGIDQIKSHNILCSYSDNKRNFIFELALDILKKSRACKLYLQAKYFKIYIDEYQDCDKDMHDFFMYICDHLNIYLFVVGDEKQSIYRWRGAYPEAFHSIWEKTNFEKRLMTDNYRSCIQIQNYTNLLHEETKHLFRHIEDRSPIILVHTSTNNWANDVLPHLDTNAKMALLRYRKDDAESGATALSNFGFNVTYVPQPPIADITTNVAWLYNALANFFILHNYSVYDIQDEIPNEAQGNRKVLSYLKKSLEVLQASIWFHNIYSFVNNVRSIANYFGYNAYEEHCKKLYETITNEKFYPYFKKEDLDKIAITFHSSKGLEFDQVILFASDFPLSNAEEIDNHYVAATRAKSKLIIVYDYSYKARCYFNNFSNILNKYCLPIDDIISTIYPPVNGNV